MTRRSSSWACVAGIIAGLAFGDVARADRKECSLDELTGELECTLIASPSRPRVVRLSEDLPLEWLRLLWQDNEALQRGVGCVRTAGGIQEIGVAWAVSLRNTETGEQLRLETVCEWPGEDPPQPPPPPPTPEQLAEDNEQTLTLRPAMSPAIEIGGLTGLDSWLWCDDPGNVAAGATLNGWIAEGAVDVVEVGWEIEGPSGLEFEVLDADPRRVKRLRVHRRTFAPANEAGEGPANALRPESAAAE